MPTILTPPEIDRRHDRGTDRHLDVNDGDNGGRRPPTDKRTGGNGDGDNWSNRPQGRRGPRERLSAARVGLFFALGGDLMFFVALVSIFFVDKSSGHFDAYGVYVHSWKATVIPEILWKNTGILLLSSLTAEIARQRMFDEKLAMDEWLGLGRPVSSRAGIWLGLTLVLGSMFLTGQWMAWRQLAAQGVFFSSSMSSHFFYLITVTHAVHLFLGIGALIGALLVLWRSRSMLTRQVLVDGTVWYWHVMGVLWVFLFALLEFGQ
jgi:cytochrome c oxidase subunit 3